MFNAYEFTFAGESSLMHGLMLYDFGGTGQGNVGFGNKASVAEARTNSRIQPIHSGVNYHKTPLEFKLVFGAERALDRYEMESIAMWLTGYQEYQWLSIDQPDLARVQFRCLVTSLTPLAHGWLPVAFEATVLCDCPYAYGYPFEQSYTLSGNTQVLFRNESSVREYLKPVLRFRLSPGVGEVRIVNRSDGDRAFVLSALPQSALDIQIDNNSGIIQELNQGYNLYSGFNLNFFRLVQGDNILDITGSGAMYISGRLMYNVAG